MAAEAKVTDREIRAAIKRGREADRTEPRAASARYDAGSGRVVMELTNGCSFAFPARFGQGLEGASSEQLAAVEVQAGGRALHWEELDVDLGVAPLVKGIFGSAAWMLELRSEMAREGGRATSPEKARAARENGRKGGRPRKHPAPSADDEAEPAGRQSFPRRRAVA